MASRTFGGTIKLTGEDEYRKALSNIRENLSVVSSELKVVTSSFDKNNASVKNLSDTNDVLIKKLDSQKQKLEVLKKALADAEEETGSNSSTTMKWQTELNKAQAEVNKTTLEIQKNVQQMKDLEEQSKKTSNEVNKLSGNFKDTGDSSKKFGDIVKGNVVADFIVEGIKTIASEVIEMGKAFLEIGNTVQKSSNQMKASLGLTNEEAKEYDKIMKDIYNNNYGDSFEDVATKIGYVRQATGEIDPSKIEELTTNAIALEDTFGSDFNETIRGVSNLMTHFGISSEEAFDLFAKGSQEGLDYTSELGDNVAEYGGNFAQAGYSAQEYFQLLENGTQNGAYNLDKVNDSINEIKNKLGDGSIKANLSLYSTETQKAFKNWEKGKGTMKDVINSIVSDISNCKNEQKQLTMASTAFGTMGEDANLKVVTSLTTVGDKFNDVKGSMESIKDIKYDDIGSAFEGIKRQLETNLVTPIYNQFLPAFNDLSKGLSDSISGNKIDTKKIGKSVGEFIADIGTQIVEGLPQLASFLLDGIVGLIESLAPNLGEITGKLMDGLVEVAGSLAEQLPTLIPQIISAIIDALAAFNDHMDDFMQMGFQIIWGLIQGVINSIPDILANLPTIIMAIINFFSLSKFLSIGKNIVSGLWNGIKGMGGSLSGWIKGFAKNILNFFKSPLEGIKNIGSNLVKGLWNGIKDMVGWIGDKIKGFGKSVLNGLKSFFGIKSPSRLLRDEIGKNLALGIGVGFDKEIGHVVDDIKSSIPTDYDLSVNTSASGLANSLATNKTPQENFNVTINNNSKYISPAENARQMRSQAQWYFLNKRRRA